MKNTAKVVSTQDGLATISVVRNSACEGCKQRSYCAEKSCGEEVKTTAVNLIGANVGDTVEVESDTRRVLSIGFCIFVLPILLSFAAYFVSGMFSPSTTIRYSVCFITLLMTAVIFAFILNKLLSKSVNVTITKIIERD